MPVPYTIALSREQAPERRDWECAAGDQFTLDVQVRVLERDGFNGSWPNRSLRFEAWRAGRALVNDYGWRHWSCPDPVVSQALPLDPDRTGSTVLTLTMPTDAHRLSYRISMLDATTLALQRVLCTGVIALRGAEGC